MRAGDKAADLLSRREGTIPILEPPHRGGFVEALWCQPVCLREVEPPRRESSPPQPARRRQGATPAE